MIWVGLVIIEIPAVTLEILVYFLVCVMHIILRLKVILQIIISRRGRLLYLHVIGVEIAKGAEGSR